jgi:Tol biopolymer transport system component
MSRLTFDATQDNSSPIWSPDGKRVTYTSHRNGKWGLYVKPADGTGNEELLLESDALKAPMSWSPDGQFIVYYLSGPKTLSDVFAVPMSGERKPVPILQSPSFQGYPQILYKIGIFGFAPNGDREQNTRSTHGIQKRTKKTL